MRRLVPVLALSLAACGPGVYTRAEVVYAEPVQYVYVAPAERVVVVTREVLVRRGYRSEEHTSELQSHSDLVCRLPLEKKNEALFHGGCHPKSHRARRARPGTA